MMAIAGGRRAGVALLVGTLLGAGPFLVAPAGAGAQSSAAYADSWEAAEGRLVVDLPNATIRVEGIPGDSLFIEIRALSGAATPLPAPRRGSGTVRLVAPGNTARVEAVIRVPHRFDALVRGSNGGAVVVEAIHGSITVENSNAGIRVLGARNAVLASTSNGPITAQLDALAPGAPLSFLTSNDGVSLTLPGPSVNAEVFLETDNGGILSDFELRPVGEARPIPAGGDGGSTLRATIGAGGALIRIRTDNGDIHIRRAPAG